ncbi:MAG: Rrf2 family transcriptional regulator [Acidobacteria bacterium]|nr:Rrf2 family transcriptional regulator [Acidobacteriota bacterium]
MQALFDLAHHSHGQPVPLHAIAERQGISLPFLEQIFHKLRKAGVVTSVRGPRGGYVMTRACDKLSVGEVLRLTDPGFYASALADPDEAAALLSQDQTMTRLLWRQLNEHIVGFLETVTIADLCSETHSNTCTACTCPDYVKEVQAQMQNGRPKGCAALLG